MVLREAMDISSLLFIVANLSLSELKLLWFDDLSFSPPPPLSTDALVKMVETHWTRDYSWKAAVSCAKIQS